MKILLTGATSFTGLWFARELAGAGHQVVATVRNGSYEGIRGERFKELAKVSSIQPNVSFGSESFLEILESGKFELICHHAAEMKDYRSPDFDHMAATASNTNNLRRVLDIFQGGGGQGLVLTGSVFESNEGLGDSGAFNPYGLSKTMTYEIFLYFCEQRKLKLGKFVITNPFGPYEEERFTHYLVKTWASGQTPHVRTPEYLRDNAHVSLLSRCYRKFIEALPSQSQILTKLNPSGYVCRQGEFAQKYAKEFSKRAGRELQVILDHQTDFSEPIRRYNADSAVGYVGNWEESKAWDECFEYYRETLK
ncbi:UDP-glucose 4-epimerase [Bradyrhizobium sp. GM2.2]|uniref:NAD-dependent epimerase/dehydratase family protein n=1 Tax=unclassified Bradyrhizobium TaxID=2631580 RepID=UPI001FF8D892|nr:MULTISPECIES: NAD(P)-dependent oxidoreductase [unclassified Bradyrhizobium]MCK1272938.1 NAD(P)-dependent oxidoreductase [Bradyrhizobium sp. 84]MCK1373033.1 NAD(P)-dependent oxidoreductase [Bradyrhizobium sp. 49]MCK1429215.1 NAD(P)-dependent oxidoreductase [Bradyrhizobium sp. 87]